jgi:hypothetical protein
MVIPRLVGKRGLLIRHSMDHTKQTNKQTHGQLKELLDYFKQKLTILSEMHNILNNPTQ